MRKRNIVSYLFALTGIIVMLVSFGVSIVSAAEPTPPPGPVVMDLSQTLSDNAQMCTIAFDGFAFVTGNFEAQTFFPPGKVADYWGFQYMRDNTPDGNGHNTSFLTNVAFNVLYILNSDQFAMLKTLAANQVDQINLYGYKRFPLMKAFRRQLDADIPAGSTSLNLDSVKSASRELYQLDGQISFDRAVVYANIYRTLSASQKASLDAMKAGGFDSWTVTSEMDAAVRDKMRGITHDMSVALMTYAGDLFSWYAGSLDADVYFCPERQGTYFGSFYVKDAPAIGHEGYKIDEQLTASAGQAFLDELATNNLDTRITDLVDQQRDNLYAGTMNIVQIREEISALLRSLITTIVPSSDILAQVQAQVLEKSGVYGELDGEIVYLYTMAFSQVYDGMTVTQKANMAALRKTIMSGTYNGTPFDFSICTTPYLYSAVITDLSVLEPFIGNTDYLFFESATSKLTVTISGSGTGTVTSSPEGINCGSACSTSFPSGTEVTLMAAPGSDSIFAGWSGGCSGTDNGLIMMNSDIEVIATFNYIPQTGSLNVTISPQGAITAGAQWQVDNGSWQNSGATVSDLSESTHVVFFKDISGWTKANSQIVNIQRNQTTTTSGTYIQQTGSLKVTISPQVAVKGGAQWQVDNGPWQNSGATVANLTVGTHIVNFKDIVKWKSPVSKSVLIQNGQTFSTIGTYTKSK